MGFVATQPELDLRVNFAEFSPQLQIPTSVPKMSFSAVDQVVKDHVRFVPVRRIDEVLPIAMPGLLNRETKPNTPCPEPAHGVQTLRQ